MQQTQLVIDASSSINYKTLVLWRERSHRYQTTHKMNPLLLHIYLAGFLLGIAVSALVLYIDIRHHRNQALSGIVTLNHRWTTGAALVFDVVQVCLSMVGIVSTSIALSVHPGRVEILWLDVVIVCHSQLLVGNHVRRPSMSISGH